MPRLVRINGERGRWVAEVEGRWLAVIHHSLRVGATGYHHPIDPRHVGGKRQAELEAALRASDLVVVQRDKDPVSLARDGYVGVFRFTDLVIDPGKSIRLTLVARDASPK